MRRALLAFLLLSSAGRAGLDPALAAPPGADPVAVARALLAHGEPEQAIRLARRMLSEGGDNPKLRRVWLAVIADAEWERARARGFSAPEPALKALEALLDTYPKDGIPAALRLREIRLLRAAGRPDEALARAAPLAEAALDEEVAAQAALEAALAWIAKGRTGEATGMLLQASVHARKPATRAAAVAWLGWLAAREGRDAQALARFEEARRLDAAALERDPRLLAAHARVLARAGRRQEALAAANRFLDLWGEMRDPVAWSVRLLRADLLAASPDPDRRARAAVAYAKLAADAPESRFGALARLRMWMLEAESVKERGKLLALARRIERLAARFQLSPVEDEAMWDLGRLWARIAASPAEVRRALAALLRAASAQAPFAGDARRLGRRLFVRELGRLLDAGRDREAVALWRAFPALRPDAGGGARWYLRVAQAMRRLGLLDEAEAVLTAVVNAHPEDLQGEMAMLGRAYVWLERGDRDGFDRLMRWLNRREDTVFRPEALVVGARMLIRQGRHAEARQVLLGVRPADLAPRLRRDYWLARARVAERLRRWSEARLAWARAIAAGLDTPEARFHLGLAWMRLGDCGRAVQAWKQVDEAARDEAWRYHMALCLARLGRRKEADALWQALAAKDDAPYAGAARLMLAGMRAREAVR